MNEYRKFVGIFLGIELILIAISNVLYIQTDHKTLILMNVGMGIMFLLSVFLVMYIGKKILKPFHRMMSLTEDQANQHFCMRYPVWIV